MFYGLAHSDYILSNKLINNVTTKRYLTTQNIEIFNSTMLLASHCYWRLADASCLIIHNSYKLPLTKNCRCSLYYNIELPLLGLLEIFRPTVLTHMPRARGEGGTWVNFCWVCAAGLSEPQPHYSLFCGQL